MANISFSSVQLDSLKTYLNRLPTSLELSDHDVDMLTEVGGQLLRNSPGYRDFLRKNGGRRRVSPVNRSSLGLSATEQGQEKPLVAKGNKQRASMMRTKSQPAQG
jgi:hypothetical protein